VLAGVNGAGKSSVGGAQFRALGADYFNPDEAARDLLAANPAMTQDDADAAAWAEGRRLLERAISEELDFALETTLGGSTIVRLLGQALERGLEVRVWYVGLASPELCLQRVAARVAAGGHHVPESRIRARYHASLLNLIDLMPRLTELRVYDNSAPAPARGRPAPRLVLHLARGRIEAPADLGQTPEWAKPIVAAAAT